MSASPRSPEAAGHDGFSKVANVTLAFWLIKICATTVGETGGDALSMTLKLGYAVSTMIFLAFFIVALAAQLAAKRFHPAIFWIVVVATTTVGTTTSDYLDRTAGLGYVRASILLFCGVILVLIAWRRTTGSIGVDHITSRRNETFYWLTILVSNTLGTALGDFTADSLGLGFEIGALIFAGLLTLVATAHFLRLFSQSILFWAAYVLTRPLGATLGDTLTKPHAQGGLDLGRFASSGVIVAVMIALIVLTERRQARANPPELGHRRIIPPEPAGPPEAGVASEERPMLGTILVVLLILALLGALPHWGYSRGWGYYPSGGLGLVLVIVLVLVLIGRI